ncbi:MAG: MATE family efflux transporter [Treponema sp.]|jgi:putative MATE family efflux protein|nr:MATE family efflux transporter [Treponema sp.]
MFKMKTDLLSGNIIKSLLVFAIPMFLSNIFQQLYNTADMVIVGHFLGETSLASIGACAVIFELLIGFAMGVGGGFGIVVARSYGAGDQDLLKRTAAGAAALGFLLVLFISVLASLFMMPLLKLINIPPDIIDTAYSYISILIVFAIVLFTYNLCSGLLRATGNSTMPLLFLIVSSLLNIALDILFITSFNMGVRGAAVATVLAQGVSTALCLVYIFKKCPILIPSKKHFRYDAALYKELAAQGFSMGFMMSIVTLGSTVLQRGINGLGYLVIAGHIATRKLNFLCMIPVPTIAIALSTFVSQNKGADQLNRIRKAVRYGNFIAVIWGTFITVVLMFFSGILIKLLSGSNESIVIENGARYLRINSPFYMVLGMLLNFRHSLQGIGKKIVPVISSVIELTGKVTFAFFLIPYLGYFAVIICEPIIWCIMFIQLLYSFYTNPYIRGKPVTEEPAPGY